MGSGEDGRKGNLTLLVACVRSTTLEGTVMKKRKGISKLIGLGKNTKPIWQIYKKSAKLCISTVLTYVHTVVTDGYIQYVRGQVHMQVSTTSQS